MFTGIVEYPHLPSVNQAHMLGQNRHRCWIYLHPEVKKMQSEVIFQLNKQNIKESLDGCLDHNYVFEVTLVFVLNKNFWARDVSNLIKYVEDAIAEATGVNDAMHIKVDSTKVLDETADTERISIVIKPHHYESYPYKLADYVISGEEVQSGG